MPRDVLRPTLNPVRRIHWDPQHLIKYPNGAALEGGMKTPKLPALLGIFENMQNTLGHGKRFARCDSSHVQEEHNAPHISIIWYLQLPRVSKRPLKGRETVNLRYQAVPGPHRGKSCEEMKHLQEEDCP